MLAMKNPYDVLGVERNATEEEIKKAVRALSKEYHPDVWANATESEQKVAEAKMKDITVSASILLYGKRRGI